MPLNRGGAYVRCYCLGETYVDATQKALTQLKTDGLFAEEILEPIHKMELSAWSEHIKVQWPEYLDKLPEQTEFEQEMNAGNVVYGPFGAYSAN